MKSEKPFEVLPYDRENLAYALSNEFIGPEALLRVGGMIPESGQTATPVLAQVRLLQGGNLFNFPYLLTYFAPRPDGLGAQTILIENQFTSKDFLSDYATYYATCKRRYAKECKRVHFFSATYSHDEIVAWLFPHAQTEETTEAHPEQHYLGYIVVKPIPFSFMGTTLLKPFPDDNTTRRFSVTREYWVNIFGKVLKLHTLAFQSQDKATSACASSALWSAFHKVSVMFQTPCPSPSEITVFSGNLFTSEGRSFPNAGLDHHQLCKAIEKLGLVSELRNQFVGWDLQTLKGFLYGYMRVGLPVLLGIQIIGAEKHLITLTGYRNEPQPEHREKGLALVSDAIQRFYAHDDQLGPFSRISIDYDKSYPAGAKITTGWPKDGNFKDLLTAKLASLVIPVHQFIRISFEEVFHIIKRFDALIDEGGTKNCWDIFLDDGSRLKTEFSELKPPKGKTFDQRYLESVLLMPVPRFVWRAQLYFMKFLVMELLFDATDVPSGQYLISATFYHSDFQSIMHFGLSSQVEFPKKLDEMFGPQFRNVILRSASIPIFNFTN